MSDEPCSTCGAHAPECYEYGLPICLDCLLEEESQPEYEDDDIIQERGIPVIIEGQYLRQALSLLGVPDVEVGEEEGSQ